MLLAITIDQLGLTEPAPLSLLSLFINLVLGAGCAYILAWHYVQFGKTNSNRRELARVFPIVVMTTVLIISVVKSSLALSLGLVSALSIVRFRTPIKEPEELAYLFIAIALGLGFGADQRIPTIVAIAFILTILGVTNRLPGKLRPIKHSLYLNLELPTQDSKAELHSINSILQTCTTLVDMRRLDIRNNSMQATYLINCQTHQALVDLTDKLRLTLPSASISFVDQKGPLGV